MKKLLIVSMLAVVMTACSTTSPDVIERGDAQRLSQTQDATVLSVRAVAVDGSQSGVGAGIGGVVGGIAGSAIGGGRRANAVGAVIGATAGALVGNVAERAGTREEALEILIQLKSGERRAIVQAKGKETFSAGDAVILISTGGKMRVVRAPAVAAPAAAPTTKS